jgi:transcriptional regulator with XRE-family HTH domain
VRPKEPPPGDPVTQLKHARRLVEGVFPARLRALREASGLAQVDFAALVGTDTHRIRKYERGQHSPDLVSLVRLAEALDVSLDYLVGRTDVPTSHHAG